MEFIIVDKNGVELGPLRSIKRADIDLGKENTLEMDISAEIWKTVPEIRNMNYLYVPNTEIGGLVRKKKSMTAKSLVKITGRTWRGVLEKKIICPTAGQDYLVVSGNLNNIINSLLVKSHLNGLFHAPDTAGINISTYQFKRYTTLLEGLTDMLKSVNKKLKLTYIPPDRRLDGTYNKGYVKVEAASIIDYSKDISFNNDGKLNFVATDDHMGVTHLICLGPGELKDRMVLHLYADEHGNISERQYYTNLDEVEDIYDFGNAKDKIELREKGIERLRKLMNKQNIEIIPEHQDLELGDIVGGKDDITGIDTKKPVERMLVKIKDDGTSTIEYKVGD